MKPMALRSEHGMSLATVVVLGVVSSMWLLGTAALVTGSAGKVARERTSDLMRNSAEAGLDWAVAQLNDPKERAKVDGLTIPIPSSVLAHKSFTGTVTVASAPAPAGSYLYDRTIDWTLSKYNPIKAANPANAVFDGNGWRAVTASVTGGGFRKSIRVILKPVYASTTQVTSNGNQPAPYVHVPVASPGNITGIGQMVTSGYISSATQPLPTIGVPPAGTNKGDIIANGIISLGNNSIVSGTVFCSSTAPNATVNVPSVQMATTSSNVRVGGLQANGGSDINVPGNLLTGGVSVINQVSVIPVETFAPPPSAPSTAVPTAINLTGTTVLALTAGDYVAPSISIANNAKLMINSTKGPVNIYVSGSGSSNGIIIGGQGISNASKPSNLRIWYAGNGNVQIGPSTDLSGVIYAPNAPVSLTGSRTVIGAVVGASINKSGNGSIIYDNNLTTSGPMYYPASTSSSTAQVVQNFQTISWFEF